MLLCGNEFHVQGVGLVVEVFNAPGGRGWGAVEGFGFFVGTPADHHRPDDPGQLARSRRPRR